LEGGAWSPPLLENGSDKASPSMKRILAIAIGMLTCTAPVRAGEAFQCKQAVEAYDVKNPDQLMGRFEASTNLEIEDYVASAKMFRVLYKSPDGKEVRALCRPDALGKKPPESVRAGASASFAGPSKPGTSGRESAGSPIPLFASLEQLQPAVWETPSSKFALLHSSYGFRWVSLAEKNEARWAPVPPNQPIRFLDQPLCESIVRFNGGRLEEIRQLFFSRGDAGKDMAENDFSALRRKLEDSVNRWLGAEGMEVADSSGVADTKRKSWFKVPLHVDLEWSVTQSANTGGFRAEFLRIVITPYDGKTDVAQLKAGTQPSGAVPVKAEDLKARIKRDSTGDVYLDGIPMVDQGQKGYCAVASVERVMRFFGLRIDQNEMAKMADTATTGGTSYQAMYAALKKMGSHFSLVVKDRIHFDIKDFIKEVEDYNALAKKNNKAEIVLPESGAIDVSAIYKSMDPDLVRTVSGERRAGEKVKFKQEVLDAINGGVPLFWSVELGIVPETPALRQANGGHMRLIIGYNEKTSEIIYTDSWGAGHEFKKMKLDSAFSITRGLYTVMPGA
jgi:hypothetical protein